MDEKPDGASTQSRWRRCFNHLPDSLRDVLSVNIVAGLGLSLSLIVFSYLGMDILLNLLISGVVSFLAMEIYVRWRRKSRTHDVKTPD
jgi:hypothetical protein